MKVQFTERAWGDYLFWQESDRVLLERINKLIGEIARAPFGGLGKPEPLRNELAGAWSRRINHEHRMIYRVVGRGDEQRIEIIACRYHYRQR